MKVTEKQLLRRLKETPLDLELRIEYAAWLDQHAEPNKALLLRLAVEEAELTCLRDDSTGPGLTDDQWTRLSEVRYSTMSLSHEIDSHWLVDVDPQLWIPNGLSELGMRAARTIVEFVADEGWTYSGFGRAFLTPAEFDGGETVYTRNAVLVVCHGEGLLDASLGMAPGGDALQERLCERLDEIGVWSELHDESTSMIHPDDYPGFAIGLG
ncbi:MAG: hypothetical protein JSS02_04540 [Planctomycetes bacterium]|nr:hypothetical protein [Planctomycetota bacterium]